jgi:hypothetical protein
MGFPLAVFLALLFSAPSICVCSPPSAVGGIVWFCSLETSAVPLSFVSAEELEVDFFGFFRFVSVDSGLLLPYEYRSWSDLK